MARKAKATKAASSKGGVGHGGKWAATVPKVEGCKFEKVGPGKLRSPEKVGLDKLRCPATCPATCATTAVPADADSSDGSGFRGSRSPFGHSCAPSLSRFTGGSGPASDKSKLRKLGPLNLGGSLEKLNGISRNVRSDWS